jgi:hypothetical protein
MAPSLTSVRCTSHNVCTDVNVRPASRGHGGNVGECGVGLEEVEGWGAGWVAERAYTATHHVMS